jgi:hypothetical protein
MEILSRFGSADRAITHLYPTRPARPKVKKLSMNAVPVALPSATAVPIPPVTRAISLVAFCHGVIATDASFSAAVGVGGGVTGGGSGRGAGDRISPL